MVERDGHRAREGRQDCAECSSAGASRIILQNVSVLPGKVTLFN